MPACRWSVFFCLGSLAAFAARVELAAGTSAAGGGSESPAPANAREHWSFQPPRKEAPPAQAIGALEEGAAEARGPIDAFILSKLHENGLSPQPPAPRELLLRRLYVDLTGLPPSLEEVDRFLADPDLTAYEKVVDRLLASPRYGERWARHWMDVWRYSDPWGLGDDIRNSQKHIWRWRDWMIDSLNADKAYDQMLREMLAADELYPEDLDRLRATGFLVRHYFKFNRTTWLDETIEHTFKAFLGMTFNCAKCHDHKYDPLTQNDYYRLRAFFEPYQVRTDMLPGTSDLEKDGLVRAFDANLDAPTYLFERGDDRRPVKDHSLEPQVPRFLAFAEAAVESVDLPPAAHSPGLRPYALENALLAAAEATAAARRAVEEAERKASDGAKGAATDKPSSPEVARAALEAARLRLRAAELQPDALRARSAAEHARWLGGKEAGSAAAGGTAGFGAAPSAVGEAVGTAREAAHRAAELEKAALLASAEADAAQAEADVLAAPAAGKAEAQKKLAALREAVTRAVTAAADPGETYTPIPGGRKSLESNVETEDSRARPFPTQSTGRRAALARWITDPRNPLTARVAVHHVWSRHFVRPLVTTVFDFGRKGTPPTHPELLDFLAVELVESGWSLKRLHREIVTSSSYRRGSSSLGAGAAAERDPENRWYWRMNPRRMESEVVRDTLLFLAGSLDERLGGPPVPVNDEASVRRSLYFVHSHNEHVHFLSAFDDASVLECYRRAESIVPQQALALTNDRLVASSAAKIAARIDPPGDLDDAAFIARAWRAVLGFAPAEEEVGACREALRQLVAALDPAAAESSSPGAGVRRKARAGLVTALLNHNDFITVR